MDRVSQIVKGRKQAGLSQVGLADRAGISLRTLEQLEKGRLKSPRESTLRVLEWAIEREQEKAA